MAEETGTSQSPEKTFTQEEMNAIIGDRLARMKAKYADYEDLKADAEAYRQQQEASKTEVEKLQEQVAALTKEKEAREAADKHAALVASYCEKYHIDPKYASLLTANDEEGMTKQAELLGEKFAEPSARDGNKPAGVAPEKSDAKEFAHAFFTTRNK